MQRLEMCVDRTRFLRPAQVCPAPNSISIGSAVFAGLTGVPSTQTDTHATERARSNACGAP